jgi:predicted ATPase
MNENIKETLEINNFLSISYMKWEISAFNILTGDMGSGKSLCIKLLSFFENIFISSILLAPGFSKKLFENGNFFDKLSDRLKKTFYLSVDDCLNLDLKYICKTKSRNFSVFVSWNKSKDNLDWKCNYLEERLKNWSRYFPEKETPDTARDVKNRIHEEIKHDFDFKLPLSNFFVPASRATITVVSANTTLKEEFLKDFADDKDYLLRNFEILLRNNKLSKILKIKNIHENENDENDVVLEHIDGRTVPTLYSSSGQQELVYLLLLLDKLPIISFKYGETLSFFIEEPSAHLFPQEQKETIECIVDFFRNDKEMDTRLFITTHSPYILNSLNNMLKKGNLLKTYENMEHEINDTVNIPYLYRDETSAYFLGPDPNNEGKFIGKTMFDNGKRYLNTDQITAISESIYEDTEKLDDFEYKVKNNI